jgi:exosortase/archaeosortase family protein
MISLFFGEIYRQSIVRRLGLVLAGFALAFVFNVARTVLLVSVAAAKAVSAIASWHDPAGVTILVGCFVSLWGVAELLKPKKLKGETLRPSGSATTGRGGYQGESLKAKIAEGVPHQRNEGINGSRPGSEFSGLRSPVVWSLLAFVLFSEISVEGWYRWHERRLPAPVTWTVQLPTDDRTYSPIPFPPKTQQYLRYDEGLNGSWKEGENRRWQAIFLRWNPGATAVHLAKNHTPEVCLTAAGRNVEKGSELQTFQVGELQLPFRVYHILDADGGMYVFYCLWPDRADRREFDTTMLTYANRLAPVVAGIRNSGQRSLEVAVWGIPDRGEAEQAFHRELGKLIKSGP